MTRRKATRGKAKSLKTIDPNASIAADGNDQQRVKKEAFLRDFDLQVKNRIRDLESKTKDLMDNVTRQFNLEKMTIPKSIRSMKVHEFLENGGDVCLLELVEISDALDCNNISFSETIEPEFKQPVASSSNRPIRKRTNVSNAQENLPPSRTRGRGRVKRDENGTVVPITPKFDPRMPITTARQAKLGETLLSLSGSPVINNSRKSLAANNILSLTLNKQQTLLGGSIFEETGAMSPNTLMTSKERLQEAMDAINTKLSNLSNMSNDSTKNDSTKS